MPLHEDVVAGGDTADIAESGRVILHGGIGQRLLERGGFDDDPERRSVLRRDLVEIIRGLEAPCSRHVLRNDRRLTRNVPAEMARDHAAVEIVAAAGGVADGDGERLAREELLDRLRGSVTRCQQQHREGRGLKREGLVKREGLARHGLIRHCLAPHRPVSPRCARPVRRHRKAKKSLSNHICNRYGRLPTTPQQL
jgi:hypothetical protein